MNFSEKSMLLDFQTLFPLVAKTQWIYVLFIFVTSASSSLQDFSNKGLKNSCIIQLKGMKMNLVENAVCPGEKLCCALCSLAL